MTVLFSGLQVTLGGIQSQNLLAIASDLKVPGTSQVIRLSVDATVFPLGTTTLGIGLSRDGGSTWQTASMTCPGSLAPSSGKWVMNYGLGTDDVPTHVRVTVDAALGFSTNMTVEVL